MMALAVFLFGALLFPVTKAYTPDPLPDDAGRLICGLFATASWEDGKSPRRWSCHTKLGHPSSVSQSLTPRSFAVETAILTDLPQAEGVVGKAIARKCSRQWCLNKSAIYICNVSCISTLIFVLTLCACACHGVPDPCLGVGTITPAWK